MKDNRVIKNKLSALKKRVEKRKKNGYVFSQKKNTSVENAFYNDLKYEVYKTL